MEYTEKFYSDNKSKSYVKTEGFGNYIKGEQNQEKNKSCFLSSTDPTYILYDYL